MTAYFVANIRVHDEVEYRAYLDACDEVFARSTGTYLAVDASPTVLEGSWPYSRSVIISFPGEDDLLAWYRSPQYQEVLRHRLAGADCDTIVVHGTDPGAA